MVEFVRLKVKYDVNFYIKLLLHMNFFFVVKILFQIIMLEQEY